MLARILGLPPARASFKHATHPTESHGSLNASPNEFTAAGVMSATMVLSSAYTKMLDRIETTTKTH